MIMEIVLRVWLFICGGFGIFDFYQLFFTPHEFAAKYAPTIDVNPTIECVLNWWGTAQLFYGLSIYWVAIYQPYEMQSNYMKVIYLIRLIGLYVAHKVSAYVGVQTFYFNCIMTAVDTLVILFA
eukprot:TRINITY_DN10787_c0_g1_i1.p1 TRINITY_DN10787_c0_g1~~TRINITY_DN10787_c0_g1_i1.p1  ORF type:complete len:124 (+),score=17.44 TRINITY_DN10787_c0_g1_i1:55-426(+)